MLFNFALTPLEQVEPWGKAHVQGLHWFGLADGQYWIQVGENTSFEYSKSMQLMHERPRYREYQVARLYEDLIEMVPNVLDAVAEALISYLSGAGGASWHRKSDGCFAATHQQANDDRYSQIADAAASWIGHRTSDTAYLSPSANILCGQTIEMFISSGTIPICCEMECRPGLH